jgi:hypothetical protein
MRKSAVVAILRGMWGFGGIFGSFTRERTSAAVLGVAALKNTAEFIEVHDGLSALSGCCPPFTRQSTSRDETDACAK